MLPAGVVEGSGVVQLVVSGTGVDDVAHNAVVSIAVVPLLVVGAGVVVILGDVELELHSIFWMTMYSPGAHVKEGLFLQLLSR